MDKCTNKEGSHRAYCPIDRSIAVMDKLVFLSETPRVSDFIYLKTAEFSQNIFETFRLCPALLTILLQSQYSITIVCFFSSI